MNKQKKTLVTLVVCVLLILALFVPTAVFAYDEACPNCDYEVVSPRDLLPPNPVED